MSSPLTSRQKSRLARLALRAFNLAATEALGRGEVPARSIRLAIGADPLLCATPSGLRDAFRRYHVHRACQKLGLRCCVQEDYKIVEAHFLDLLGQPGAALNALLAAASEPRRIAEYKLREACRDAGVPLAYAEKICRDQNHGAGLDDADLNTLWRLIFTLRNRAKTRAKSSPKQNADRVNDRPNETPATAKQPS